MTQAYVTSVYFAFRRHSLVCTAGRRGSSPWNTVVVANGVSIGRGIGWVRLRLVSHRRAEETNILPRPRRAKRRAGTSLTEAVTSVVGMPGELTILLAEGAAAEQPVEQCRDKPFMGSFVEECCRSAAKRRRAQGQGPRRVFHCVKRCPKLSRRRAGRTRVPRLTGTEPSFPPSRVARVSTAFVRRAAVLEADCHWEFERFPAEANVKTSQILLAAQVPANPRGAFRHCRYGYCSMAANAGGPGGVRCSYLGIADAVSMTPYKVTVELCVASGYGRGHGSQTGRQQMLFHGAFPFFGSDRYRVIAMRVRAGTDLRTHTAAASAGQAGAELMSRILLASLRFWGDVALFPCFYPPEGRGLAIGSGCAPADAGGHRVDWERDDRKPGATIRRGVKFSHDHGRRPSRLAGGLGRGGLALIIDDKVWVEAAQQNFATKHGLKCLFYRNSSKRTDMRPKVKAAGTGNRWPVLFDAEGK
ncbi:hypothetical protein FQR65_LT20845 [Abscondita terminalis]|nr:hypothetical protein FQR65_LT20845 [Abscondita terminalis]